MRARILVAALAIGLTAPASGAPTAPPVVVPAEGTPAQLPVLDITAEVQTLVLPTANLDGSLTDIDGKRFRLDANVLFRFDESDITPKGEAALAELVGKLEAAKATRVRIDGYTDDVGETAYNLRLSQRRADAVRDRLEAALGGKVTVTSAGHGEQNPVASNETKAGQALNRRVTVVVEK